LRAFLRFFAMLLFLLWGWKVPNAKGRSKRIND
jgi:hypothetical protein